MALHRVAGAREQGRQDHAPHLGMHVVQEDQARPAIPEGRQEGHPVPDLDQRVTRAVPHPDPLPGRTGEDGVPTGPAQHAVAVAGDGRRRAGDGRGAERDVETGGSPVGRHHVRVELRAPCLRVVEVAPGHEVDTPDPGLGGQGSQLARRGRRDVGRRAGHPRQTGRRTARVAPGRRRMPVARCGRPHPGRRRKGDSSRRGGGASRIGGQVTPGQTPGLGPGGRARSRPP